MTKSQTLLDLLNGMGQGFTKGQLVDFYGAPSMGKSNLAMARWLQSTYTIFDEATHWKHEFGKNDFLEVQETKYCKKVFKIFVRNKNYIDSKTDVSLYHDSFEMDKQGFLDLLKKEFNAVSKNHDSVFFRSEEDAIKAREWMESVMVANKLKKAK